MNRVSIQSWFELVIKLLKRFKIILYRLRYVILIANKVFFLFYVILINSNIKLPQDSKHRSMNFSREVYFHFPFFSVILWPFLSTIIRNVICEKRFINKRRKQLESVLCFTFVICLRFSLTLYDLFCLLYFLIWRFFNIVQSSMFFCEPYNYHVFDNHSPTYCAMRFRCIFSCPYFLLLSQKIRGS